MKSFCSLKYKYKHNLRSKKLHIHNSHIKIENKMASILFSTYTKTFEDTENDVDLCPIALLHTIAKIQIFSSGTSIQITEYTE